MKLCVDCKHCVKAIDKRYWCTSDKVMSIDCVTGYEYKAGCYAVRAKDGLCGEDGKYFEQRSDKPIVPQNIDLTTPPNTEYIKPKKRSFWNLFATIKDNL